MYHSYTYTSQRPILVMADRIHVVLDPAEKERFRAAAEREGKTLSAWLRDVAQDRLRARSGRGLDTADELGAFFRHCDEREVGREPDWESHRRVIERSVASGATDT